MAKSNRDRVSEVMDALKEGLGPFVLREYKQIHKGARYLQEVELTLNSSGLVKPDGAPVERCVQDAAR
jgi:hypothetical protein